jgi:hypothetical protein
LLFAVALILFAWGAIVTLTGGVDTRVLGIDIKSRDPFRAFLLSFIIIAGLAVFARAELIRSFERLGAPFDRFAPALATAMAIALGAYGVYFGSFCVGGADSYGYVNQAYDWVSGELPRPQPVALELPFPGTDEMQIPLGYRTGPQPHTMVPTYAPGLPLVMAVFLLAGSCGPFFVVPLSAIAFLVFTYLLGDRAGGRVVGLLAAVLALTSPTVLYQTLWPMSDIPAGAAWTAGLWFSLHDSRRRAAAAGAVTALGLLIRPNLLLAVAVPLAQVMLAARGRERLVRGALFGLWPGLAAVAIAVLNTVWYGAPQNSGYGAAADIYQASNIWPNIKLYAGWFRESETLGVLIALVPLVPFLARGIEARVIRLCAAMFLATFACYITYAQFEVWWYLRFLMPAGGALAVMAAAGLVAVARVVPRPVGQVVFVILVWLAVSNRIAFASGKFLFGPLQASERRYVDIGEFIDGNLPKNAALFSVQHSGSLRFYTGRHTVRFDWVKPEWAMDVVPALERAGFHPYLVIDDFEADQVREQFAIARDAPLPWPIVARMREMGGMTVLDMASTAGAISPVALEPGSKHWCAPRHEPVR